MVHASPTELTAGEFRPKVYASVTLNPTEQRYSQTERQSLAVSWASQKFHYYIYQPFVKLLSIRGSPTPTTQRWLLKLLPYSYITNIDHKYMNASDVLSRNPLSTDTNTLTKDTEHFINNIISDAVPLSVSLDEIKSKTLSDPDLC